MESQKLQFNALVTGGGTITQAWYRFDGDAWISTAPGAVLSESDISLARLSTGCHTLAVRVADDSGRPGQDLRVFNVYEAHLRLAPIGWRRN